MGIRVDMRRLAFMLLGILIGYIIYLPMLLIIEYAFRRAIDSERSFYALYDPLLLPYLLTPAGWRVSSPDDIVSIICGGTLLIAGCVVGFRRAARPG